MKYLILATVFAVSALATEWKESESYEIGTPLEIVTTGLKMRVSSMPCIHQRLHSHHRATEQEFRDALLNHLAISRSEWKNGYLYFEEGSSEAKIFKNGIIRYTAYLKDGKIGRLFDHETNEVTFFAKERSSFMNPKIEIDGFEQDGGEE